MSGGTVYGKYFFRWEKFAIFSDSERFSYFWRKTLPDLRISQSTYPWKFLGKNIFWNLYNLPHLFGLWTLKKRLVGKVFSRVVTNAIHASWSIFWLKVIFLRKIIFVHLFWSLSNFLLSFDKKSQGVRETTSLYRKKLEEHLVEKLFFLLVFGLRAEKFEQLDEENSQNFQNYVQSVQGNILGRFFWNEEALLKIFGRWAKLFHFWCQKNWQFCQNCSLRVQRNVWSFFWREK